jgi:hypothetical protein
MNKLVFAGFVFVIMVLCIVMVFINVQNNQIALAILMGVCAGKNLDTFTNILRQ